MANAPSRDRTIRRMRVVTWSVCLVLLVFVVTTRQSDLGNLGTLTGMTLVLLGYEVHLPGTWKP